MTREEMILGFSQGRTLVQEEWTDKKLIKQVDNLIAEGYATATPWEYSENFQCERRYITGTKKK